MGSTNDYLLTGQEKVLFNFEKKLMNKMRSSSSDKAAKMREKQDELFLKQFIEQ